MTPAQATEMIDRWVDDGVITPSQAQRMRAGDTAPVRRTATVAESLGYLGGALVTFGANRGRRCRISGEGPP